MSYQEWTNSATFLAHLYLTQEQKVMTHIFGQAERVHQNTGGSYSSYRPTPFLHEGPLSVSFELAKIELDEWAEGVINWKEIAINLEESKGWGMLTCCVCGSQINHHLAYSSNYEGVWCSSKCYDTRFELCDLCGCKNLTVKWNAANKFCFSQPEPEHACDACLMTKYGLTVVTITSGSMSRGR